MSIPRKGLYAVYFQDTEGIDVFMVPASSQGVALESARNITTHHIVRVWPMDKPAYFTDRSVEEIDDFIGLDLRGEYQVIAPDEA